MENFLAQKRGEKALTRAQLAARVGASEADVARWEAGELPDSRCLLPLAEALGVAVEDILRAAGGEEASGNADVAENGAASGGGGAEGEPSALALVMMKLAGWFLFLFAQAIAFVPAFRFLLFS